MLKASSWGARLKLLRAAFRLGLNPGRTEEVFHITSLFIGSSGQTQDEMKRYAADLMALPGMRAIYEERYLPERPDIAVLARYPAGTLGRAFADHMQKYDLAVDFYPDVEVVDEMTYMTLRARQTHDILHVVLGFSTSIPDEMGLQAFEAAMINSPLSVGIIGGGLVRSSLVAPWMQRECLEATLRGYHLGKLAKVPMLAYKFEDNWAKPLTQVRAELGLEAVAAA
jgi:ubiquinone biosynthesis protein COQ4